MAAKKTLNAREASLLALTKIEEEKAFANLALADVFAAHALDERDKRLAAEITYGVVTYRLTLDWLINQITGRPVTKLDRPVLHALRIGFYQLLYLERLPAPAVVHSTVELIKKGKKRTLAPFVNGVLRGFLRKKSSLPWPDPQLDPLAYLTLRYAHPEWLVKRWLERFGREETEKLLAANNQVPPLAARVNTLRINRDALLQRLAAENIRAFASEVVADGVIIQGGGNLTAVAAYREGLMQIQGQSAMLTSHILQPTAGAKVLDGCSAPGGKATHLAQLMENSGEIIALDLYEHRLALVEANARRLGVKIIQTACLDVREIKPAHFGLFDHILLDVPCSGLGVIRRKPDIKWRRQEEDIISLAVLQREILAAAVRVLKPGGTLVYSTCTNEPEETEEIIRDFLSHHSDFTAAELTPYLPVGWQEQTGAYGIQLYPHLQQVDGFFIAKLQKIS
jgi:16S rRNA (cytosine967-C5)-methyltransferase